MNPTVSLPDSAGNPVPKVVVTGALGHIGARLLRSLPFSFPGSEIVLVDNLSSRRFAALFELPPQGCYRFHEADVLKDDLAANIDGASAVVHLAALTNATESLARAKEVEEVNFVGTEKVARACLKTGAALIFPSSTSVYGSQAEEVDEGCPESDLKPQSPYAASKLQAERLLQEMGERDGLRFITCRFGTIFGTSRGMRFDTAVNKFCWQAALGLPITVWRTALHQYRPYLDLSDCVKAIEFILRRQLYDRGIYNVLSLNATVSQVLEAISTFIPDLSMQLVDEPIMNQLSYHVSSARFQALGFAFEGNLSRGIGQTLQLLKGIRR